MSSDVGLLFLLKKFQLLIKHRFSKEGFVGREVFYWTQKLFYKLKDL